MKFHQDYYIKNSYFKKAASKQWGIYKVRDLNILETIFLESIDYKLMIDQTELDQYYNLIMKKSKELQEKEFKVTSSRFEILEDHFYSEQTEGSSRTRTNSQESIDVPLVVLDGKVFKNQDEIYNFFQCDELCENTTWFCNENTYDSISDSSPSI